MKNGTEPRDDVVDLVNAKMKLCDAISKTEVKLAEQRATLVAINARLQVKEREHAAQRK